MFSKTIIKYIKKINLLKYYSKNKVKKLVKYNLSFFFIKILVLIITYF